MKDFIVGYTILLWFMLWICMFRLSKPRTYHNVHAYSFFMKRNRTETDSFDLNRTERKSNKTKNQIVAALVTRCFCLRGGFIVCMADRLKSVRALDKELTV